MYQICIGEQRGKKSGQINDSLVGGSAFFFFFLPGTPSFSSQTLEGLFLSRAPGNGSAFRFKRLVFGKIEYKYRYLHCISIFKRKPLKKSLRKGQKSFGKTLAPLYYNCRPNRDLTQN